MEKLSSYVTAVSFTVILSVIFELLVSDKKFRYVTRIVSGIIILYVLFKPLGKMSEFDFEKIIDNFETADNYNEDFMYYEEKAKKSFDDAVYKASSTSIKKEIESYVYAGFNRTITADVKLLDGTLNIDLYGDFYGIKNDVEAYIKSNFGVEPKFCG